MYSIDVAKDFSPLPFGRDEESGDFHGKKFREELLEPALENHQGEKIELDFSGIEMPPGTSFLSEAIARLVLNGVLSKDDVFEKINIKEHQDFNVRRVVEKQLSKIKS